MTVAQQCECTQCLRAHLKMAQTVNFKLSIFEHTHTHPTPTCSGNILKHQGAEKPARVCVKAVKTESRDTRMGRAACLPAAESEV